MINDALMPPQVDKADIAAQLVRRAEEWIRGASPRNLVRVMMSGGLSPVIVDDDGRVLTGIELSDRPGGLSKIGVIWSDLPANETLEIFAVVWGASEPPTAPEALEAWLATDKKAQDGARRFMYDEIDESLSRFQACVEEWLESKRD